MSTVFFESECFLRSRVENGLEKKISTRICGSKTVTVEASDRNGVKHTYTGENLLARAFCHELDRLDGVLFKAKLL